MGSPGMVVRLSHSTPSSGSAGPSGKASASGPSAGSGYTSTADAPAWAALRTCVGQARSGQVRQADTNKQINKLAVGQNIHAYIIQEYTRTQQNGSTIHTRLRHNEVGPHRGQTGGHKGQLLQTRCSPNSLPVHECVYSPVKGFTCVCRKYMSARFVPLVRHSTREPVFYFFFRGLKFTQSLVPLLTVLKCLYYMHFT